MRKITYGFYNSLFGEIILAVSGKGLCWLGFMIDAGKGNGYNRMIEYFPNAEFIQNNILARELGQQVMIAWNSNNYSDISIDLCGTDFQILVWRALLNIKKGSIVSYSDIAYDIGRPKTVRAVGTAVGCNPISLVVPCHRVLQKSGSIGNYGWGIDLKRKILKAEGIYI